jgi:hypothetical protein
LQILYTLAMLAWFVAFWLGDLFFSVYMGIVATMTFTLAALTFYVAAAAARRLHTMVTSTLRFWVIFPFAVCCVQWGLSCVVLFAYVLSLSTGTYDASGTYKRGIHTFGDNWMHAKSFSEWHRSYVIFHLSVWTLPNFIPVAVFSRVMWENGSISRQEVSSWPSLSRNASITTLFDFNNTDEAVTDELEIGDRESETAVPRSVTEMMPQTVTEEFDSAVLREYNFPEAPLVVEDHDRPVPAVQVTDSAAPPAGGDHGPATGSEVQRRMSAMQEGLR